MNKKFGWIHFFMVLFFSLNAHGDVLVLVHGYLGSPTSWEASGINSILSANQWQRAGILTTSPRGVQMLPGAGNDSHNKIYVVTLPSVAPIWIQANALGHMLAFLGQKHPHEAFITVGHSVGGIVARLALVRGHIPKPTILITIASPHLGTPRAEQALKATTEDFFPLEFFKEFLAGDTYRMLKTSRSLYTDLLQPWPGSLLFWLNGQPHPDIQYVSVLRSTPFSLWGDMLVPGPSQDMNNIPALRGKSKVYYTQTDHGLTPTDGLLLVKILADLKAGR